MSQKLNTTQTAKASPHNPSPKSRLDSSRSPVQSARTTPEAPKPSSAVDMTRKPKWYHSVTESTRVSANSRRSVAKEMRNSPTKCRMWICPESCEAGSGTEHLQEIGGYGNTGSNGHPRVV